MPSDLPELLGRMPHPVDAEHFYVSPNCLAELADVVDEDQEPEYGWTDNLLWLSEYIGSERSLHAAERIRAAAVYELADAMALYCDLLRFNREIAEHRDLHGREASYPVSCCESATHLQEDHRQLQERANRFNPQQDPSQLLSSLWWDEIGLRFPVLVQVVD